MLLQHARPTRIVMWHGGRQWDGASEIRPGRKGGTEQGPGIYCTNHYLAARRYAKEEGQVRKLELEPRLLLESAALPLQTVERFVRDNTPKRVHKQLLGELRKASSETDLSKRILIGDAPHCPAESILNLCVAAELAHGARGLALATLFIVNGIDASLQRINGNEVWGVIFNPACIKSNTPADPDQVDAEQYQLPDPLQSLEQGA